ncbi:Protein of unknown function [Roseivivax marinus]|uniref:DUF1217 domain-containing protein n=1 Tax=Roseivivax marinus TaxID=1379903 RepID=UPI0008AB2F55|nr:DUF1217 domain-containing protein [Roseivivax marinus]SEL15007.1 Protein of unknown function [Roseivivax marinus]
MSFTPVIPASGLAGWAYLSRTRQDQQRIHENSAQTQRDIAAFKFRIGDIETADQLLDDRATLRVALGAFGLEEEIGNRAFLERVLTSDLSDRTSLANKLSDKRFLAFAQAFGFNGDGPRLLIEGETGLGARLSAVESAEELIATPSLLREALQKFGLEGDARNPFFLQSVLESDLSDPGSFANRLSDETYVEFARAFNFGAREKAASTPVARFVAAFEGRMDTLRTADDLLGDPALRSAALDVFGIEGPVSTNFLRQVLTSDPAVPESFVNGLGDRRFLALSEAFGFGTPPPTDGSDPAPSRAAAFVEAVGAEADTLNAATDVIFNNAVREVTFDFFDVSNRSDLVYLQRVMESDPANPTSLSGLHPDRRYAAMAKGFGFATPEAGRVLPEGFADEIVRRYVDRSFEVKVGEVDTTMRLALSLGRELQTVADRSRSESTQWFAVMSSPPLRQVFETAFRLPPSFGSLDLDQQLDVFRDRAEQAFGTRRVDAFTDPEKLDALRRRFLVLSEPEPQATTAGGAAAALSILSGTAGA